MESHKRSRSLPTLPHLPLISPAASSEPEPTPAPIVQRSTSLPPAPPAKEASNSGKKRKLSDAESLDTKPAQQAKKPRTQEEPPAKKTESKPSGQAKRQPAADEVSKPTVQNKAPLKQDPLSRKDKPSSKSTSAAPPISKVWPQSVGKQKIKGLDNPGNWCYRRSALQSLISIPQFFNLLQTSHKSCAKQGKCVTCAMQQLLKSYHTSPGNVGSQLRALDNAIRVTGRNSDPRWRYSAQTQEDSHEFMQYLLGTVEKATDMNQDQFASVFRIKHKISWTCDCKKVHVRSDPPGLCLNLPIQKQSGGVHLSDCLNTYHREPNVTIRCDRCKKNSKRTRIFQIEDAPDVLPIQLMRFGFGLHGSTKNKQHVEIPEDLDLARWALDKTKSLKYRLQAIVAHSGTLRSGHYIAYVRGPDGIKDISDSHVSNTTSKEWTKPTSGFNPYILVYVKQ
jgi:ubiquitin C-terminal hydrolase